MSVSSRRLSRTRAEVEGEAAEVRRLATLLEISRTLTDTLHLRDSLVQVVRILEDHPSVAAAAVGIQEEEGKLSWTGCPEGTDETSLPRAAEEIIRQVMDSNRPVVLPRVSHEPSYRASRARRGERSFLCAPLSVNARAAGVVVMELHYSDHRNYERALNFCQVVSSLVAQALRVHQLVEDERKGLVEENIYLREELKSRYDFSNIIGNSSAMRGVYEKITQVARANTTVLIRGESGTGKELIAHAIHYNSLRAQKPFIRVSCAALPETLIEAELFGYERGAFTGAQTQRKGRFELAEGGTLFLDEIGDLQPQIQVKLLRVLQEREFERLGGTETIRVNVRLIAATNKNLEDAIARGTFREDLYYRLNVFTVFVPPLRERKSDILLLADHFLEKYAGEHRKNIRRISTPAIDMLVSYHWPGNVRELENAIERAVLVCDGHVIHAHHLPPTLQTAEASDTLVRVDLESAVAAYEKDLIQDALKSARGNRAKAARLLGSTERIIGYKVKKYNIDCRRFK
jgi:Nif-specific regulatory protein